MKTKLFTILILASIFLVACGSSATPKPAVSGNGVGINISEFKFDPATITVPIGTSVTWTNQDSADHTVVADDGSWKSESLAKGATFSYTFTNAGTFTYICSIHPTMKGTIIVK
jgi:plastocyanin